MPLAWFGGLPGGIAVRLHRRPARHQDRVRHVQADRPRGDVDADDVAVLDQADGAYLLRFR